MSASAPTIYDLADELGLSSWTVAAALRGDHRVRESTAERVRAHARSRDYRPNQVAATLAQARRGRVADFKAVYLTRRTESVPRRDAMLSKFVIAYGRKRGIAVREVSLQGVVHPGALGEKFWRQGVSGLFLGHFDPFDYRPDLPWERFSVFNMGMFNLVREFDSVEQGCFTTTYELYRRAWQSGFRRIATALWSHPVAHHDDHARAGAVAEAARICHPDRAPLPAWERLRTKAPEHWEELVTDYGKWLRKLRPDCLLGFNGLDYHLALAAGYRIPADLAFVSMHLDREDIDEGVLSGATREMEARAMIAVDRMEQLLRYQVRGTPEQPRLTGVLSRYFEGSTMPAAAFRDFEGGFVAQRAPA